MFSKNPKEELKSWGWWNDEMNFMIHSQLSKAIYRKLKVLSSFPNHSDSISCSVWKQFSLCVIFWWKLCLCLWCRVWVNFQQLEPYSSKQVTVLCLKDESISKAARHRPPVGDNWSLKLVLCYCHGASQVVRKCWLSFSLTVKYSWFGTGITRNRIHAHFWRERLHSFPTSAEKVALNRDGLFPLEFCAREIKMHDSSFATWII